MWLIIGIVIVAVLFFAFKVTSTNTLPQAVPMGVYLNAIKQGASVEDAIFDAVQVLRHRLRWKPLTDDELRNAAKVFAELKDPSLFTQVVATVEKTNDLSYFRDIEDLRQFVIYANART